MEDAFRSLRQQARGAWFEQEGIPAEASEPPARRHAIRWAELPTARSRCRPADIDRGSLDALAEEFAAMHQRMYGFAAEDEPVQSVTFAFGGAGLVRKGGVPAAAGYSVRRVRRVGGTR